MNMIGDKIATPVWWPALFDALLHVVSTKAVHARLLISEWAHTSKFIGPYLRALSAAAQAGFANDSFQVGQLEIRRFRVPGWDKTEVRSRGYPPLGPTEQRVYPGHTRVNHTKYIVTDNRFNFGTSNITWDYFAGTAGSSFKSDHPRLVSTLQAIFDRDWNSPYAAPNT